MLNFQPGLFWICLSSPNELILCAMKTLPVLRSLTLLFLAHCVLMPARAHVAVNEMTEAANKFLASLTPEQNAKASFQFSRSSSLN